MYMTPAVSGNQPIQTVSNGIHQVPNVSYQNPQICASPAAYTQPNPPIQGQETDVLAAVGFSSPGVPSQSTYQTVPAMPPSSGFSSAAKTYQPNTSGYNRPAPGVSPWHQGLATPYNPNQPFPPGPPNNNSLI
uniref:Protein transport protein Sec31A n=2 Tax=Bursaphelenchus xylophilus TaxID=6326 RepID=A0A1I7RKY0_BURXY